MSKRGQYAIKCIQLLVIRGQIKNSLQLLEVNELDKEQTVCSRVCLHIESLVIDRIIYLKINI